MTESILKGLDSPLKFYPDTFYPFQVIGAGTTNQNQGDGDVKWEPVYWSTSSNPRDAQKNSAWKIGSAKGITKAATDKRNPNDPPVSAVSVHAVQ